MNAEVKKLWVDALTNDNYNQCILDFRQINISGVECHCAIGVLMDLYSKAVEEIRDWDTIDEDVIKWAGFSTDELLAEEILYIIDLNDGQGYSFKQIAQYISEKY